MINTTIYSFVPVKKKMKILEFIDSHLQQFPKCQLSDVIVVKGHSKISSHLELTFCGAERISVLIPLYDYDKITYIYYRGDGYGSFDICTSLIDALDKITKEILSHENPQTQQQADSYLSYNKNY